MSFYSYWLLVNITRKKMGNWKKLERAILGNNVNVQKQPLVFYIKAVIKNFAMAMGKKLCWSFFLIKLFQHKCFLVEYCLRILTGKKNPQIKLQRLRKV